MPSGPASGGGDAIGEPLAPGQPSARVAAPIAAFPSSHAIGDTVCGPTSVLHWRNATSLKSNLAGNDAVALVEREEPLEERVAYESRPVGRR